MLDNNSLKPIFVQIAEWLEDQILNGNLGVGERIMSQNELAVFFRINAITAARGVTILEQKGVVEKRRGIGMFVNENARELILEYRKNETLNELIDDMLTESRKLDIDIEKLISIIKGRNKGAN